MTLPIQAPDAALVLPCTGQTLRTALLQQAGWQAAPEGVYLARERHVQALRRVDSHLAQASGWLQQLAADDGQDLPQAQAHHIRGWAARLRERGLGPRSIAIALAAWRGLYKHWGRERLVTHNPVQGIRPPKAPKPLPKALGVDDAVALAQQQPSTAHPALRARDHCIVELLYGCGLRVGEPEKRTAVLYTTPLVSRSPRLRLGLRVEEAPEGAVEVVARLREGRAGERGAAERALVPRRGPR